MKRTTIIIKIVIKILIKIKTLYSSFLKTALFFIKFWKRFKLHTVLRMHGPKEIHNLLQINGHAHKYTVLRTFPFTKKMQALRKSTSNL